MNRRSISIVSFIILSSLWLAACASQGPEGPVGPAGPAGPQGPSGPPGEAASASQEYVGSETCEGCHTEVYAKFALSGHPHIMTKVENGQAPEYPFDSLTGGVDAPPEGYSWEEISYVIGGFGWKARFIDQNGYIITGDGSAQTQYNFPSEILGTEAEWVAFHPGEELAHDCGTCHTTGYTPEGSQDGMEGNLGEWAFPGVQCEACHGPGNRHAEDPYGVQMVVEHASQLCGSCHDGGHPLQMDASDGFEINDEQYADLANSKHSALSCVTCHDPHASALYEDADVNPNKGIRQSCENCHWQNTAQKVERHNPDFVTCATCHMPLLAKSAVGNSDIFTGDVHSHQFSINTDITAPQFNEDGSQVMPYLTLQYVCQSCHNGVRFSEKDLETLAEFATDYHTPATDE